MGDGGTSGSRAAALLLGLGVAGLGALILVQASQFKVAPTYARVSPTLFPTIVGGGLVALGCLLALQGRHTAAGGSGERLDRLALGLLVGGLVLHQLLLVPAGFVIASAVLFTAVVAAFGSRAVLRDAAIGLALALVVQLVLSRALGLQLPAGILGGLLG